MKHLLINLILLLSIISAKIPEINDSKWNNIQTELIEIEYIWSDNLPWCKSKINLHYSIDSILKIIKNISSYKDIFKSVIYSKEYKNNIVHIILDLPGIFSNRDYVVNFNLINDKKNNTTIYEFNTINNYIDLNEKHVRLINAAGQWRLKSISNNLTEVTYIWNGDMSGNFPSWGLKRAWIKQGNEVLGNLKTALHMGKFYNQEAIFDFKTMEEIFL